MGGHEQPPALTPREEALIDAAVHALEDFAAPKEGGE